MSMKSCTGVRTVDLTPVNTPDIHQKCKSNDQRSMFDKQRYWTLSCNQGKVLDILPEVPVKCLVSCMDMGQLLSNTCKYARHLPEVQVK